MSLLITTTAIKQYIRARRISKRKSRAADDAYEETKRALDQAAKNLATFEASRRTPHAIEDSLPPPTRSPSDASHHSRKHANPKIQQTLKRTKTFSAQILTTGTRPLLNAQRAVVNQCTIMGRGVLHPMRAMRHHADEPVAPELPSTSDALSPDQSSTESESERRSSQDSPASDDTDSTPPSSDVSLPSEEKDVKLPVARARTFPFSRALAMTFSIPSTPDRANQIPTAKGGVRRTANKDGEPIRYARPARPENSISGVVYETRFESPVKTLFRSKPKCKTGVFPLLCSCPMNHR